MLIVVAHAILAAPCRRS